MKRNLAERRTVDEISTISVIFPTLEGTRRPSIERGDEAEVIAFLAERRAGYQLPRTIEFSDAPRRDDAGKARRSAVRDEIISRRARASC